MSTPFHRLDIPYVSQLEAGADLGPGDCGFACTTAILRSVLKKRDLTVDEVTRAAGFGGTKFTSATGMDLKKAAATFGEGVTLKQHPRLDAAAMKKILRDNRPIILLVFYPRLKEPHRFDADYNHGHWILVHGFEGDTFFYDDPYWPKDKFVDGRRAGENIPIHADDLIAAAAIAENMPIPGEGWVPINHTFPIWQTGTKGVDLAEMMRAAGAGLTVRGTVTGADGKVIEMASVRLIGTKEVMAPLPRTILAPPRGAVTYNREIAGLSGSVIDIYNREVKEQTGLTLAQFSEGVVKSNPSLLTDSFRFHPDKRYFLPQPQRVIVWHRPAKGLASNRSDGYVREIEGKVEGLSRAQFVEESNRHHGPQLKDGKIFRPDVTYAFPENLWGGISYEWTRELPPSTTQRNRFQVYAEHVQPKMPMTWAEFEADVMKHNPEIAANPGPIQPGQRMLLPTPVTTSYGYILEWTNDKGEFALKNLQPGSYTLEVVAAGHLTVRQPLTVTGTTVLNPISLKKAPVPDAPTHPTGTGTGTGTVTQGGTTPPPAAPPTFVRPGKNGSFSVEGKPFRFVGANLRGIVHYGAGPLGDMQHSRPQHIGMQLDAAQSMGAKVIRLFLGSAKDDTPAIIGRLRSLSKQLKQRGMYAIVAFSDVHHGTQMYVKGDEGRHENNMFRRSWYGVHYREHYLPFVRAVVEAFKDDDRIFAWELGNEFKILENGQLFPHEFTTFANAVIDEIKLRDPHHMIATGIINSVSIGYPDNEEFLVELYRNPAKLGRIDFLVAHVYRGTHDPVEASFQEFEFQRAALEFRVARRLDKPFVLEEVGFFGNRVGQTQELLRDWLEQRRTAGVMQWALMGPNDAHDHDMSDGDERFGMHLMQGNQSDYEGLRALFRRYADQVLAQNP